MTDETMIAATSAIRERGSGVFPTPREFVYRHYHGASHGRYREVDQREKRREYCVPAPRR
jgi:hypothetical protein